jgi:tRNA-guanine family transglycosylase
MKYFASWTHSDPLYQDFLPDTCLLVSPPSVNQAWQAVTWPVMPAALIIDSGAFQYHKEGRTLPPDVVLARQLHMSAGLSLPISICHLDVPMLGTRNILELDRRITRNLEQARWLMQYIVTHGLPAHVTPIGVIQGYTPERIYLVGQILAEMGYTSFALGSLAGMVASSRDELLRRVEAALEAVGPNLHVLGVSSTTVLPQLVRAGVASIDSGAPIHEAWRGGLFYSRPFRRYKLASPHFQEWRRTYSFAEILTDPLPCDCPVCQENPEHIFQLKGKRFINLRAVHNYYHILRDLATL